MIMRAIQVTTTTIMFISSGALLTVAAMLVPLNYLNINLSYQLVSNNASDTPDCPGWRHTVFPLTLAVTREITVECCSDKQGDSSQGHSRDSYSTVSCVHNAEIRDRYGWPFEMASSAFLVQASGDLRFALWPQHFAIIDGSDLLFSDLFGLGFALPSTFVLPSRFNIFAAIGNAIFSGAVIYILITVARLAMVVVARLVRSRRGRCVVCGASSGLVTSDGRTCTECGSLQGHNAISWKDVAESGAVHLYHGIAACTLASFLVIYLTSVLYPMPWFMNTASDAEVKSLYHNAHFEMRVIDGRQHLVVSPYRDPGDIYDRLRLTGSARGDELLVALRSPATVLEVLALINDDFIQDDERAYEVIWSMLATSLNIGERDALQLIVDYLDTRSVSPELAATFLDYSGRNIPAVSTYTVSDVKLQAHESWNAIALALVDVLWESPLESEDLQGIHSEVWGGYGASLDCSCTQLP